MIITDRFRHLPRALALLAFAAGTAAWVVFLRADLVLSHYDAKAHLVVARRVFDNITPGWQQIGAVWLPLPHLLAMLPAQVDALYRTGAASSLISMASFALTAYAGARLVLAVTGSAAAATAAVAVQVLNPNLLYLQSTPMTEPLLLALSTLAVLWLYEWVREDRDRVPARLGLALAAAALTRYEAWAIIGAAFAGVVYAMARRGTAPTVIASRAARLGAWPAAAVAAFLVNSRITVGEWFVSGGFYVPDPTYQGQLGKTLIGLWWGTHQLSGYGVELVGLIGAVALLTIGLLRRDRAAAVVPVALLAAGALPLYAFLEGHPYRIRYMIPLVSASAVLGGIAAGLAGRFAVVVAAVLVASSLVESPPWHAGAPLLVEAQWDRPNSIGRREVTSCLEGEYRGEKILASMGSLAHYMQELARAGFDIADFVHEGNGVIWELAMETGPAPHAGWMLVEGQAEGGDVLAQRLRTDPAFAAGMTAVCEGGGVTLYRRQAPRGRPDP